MSPRHERMAERMAGDLDRQRARTTHAVERQAVHCRISSAITCAIKSEPQHLWPVAAVAAAETVRAIYAGAVDEAGACALYGKLAHSPIADLHKAVARAAAEKAFADHDGPQHIRGPLADGLRTIGLGSIADEVENSKC